ncbi:MAG: PTS sugar transporter subunit IIA, partial [Thermoplasmata archaeon]|nr:PTS sugar transporter subunit IIA [Thermoplasmata archaeon]
VLFALANLALIFMRKSNFKNYRPKYRAPFYPWIQIFAIGVYIFLIIEMGLVPILIVLAFSLLGLLWYFIYARGKIKREYAWLHVVKDFLGIKQKGRMLDEELRGIMIDRDDTTVARLERKICEGEVLDIKNFLAPDKFTRKIAYPIAKRLKMKPDDVYRELFRPEEESYLITRPSFAVISYHVKRRDTFEIVMVRTKRGAMFSEDSPPVHAAFVIVSSLEEKSFFMNTLMWLVRAGDRPGFAQEWKDAKGQDELKEVILRSLIKEQK